MTAPVLDRHIDITPGICGGQPRIAGHRITVADIAVWHKQMGLDADQIATEHGLTLSDVYATLAYFFDHRDAFDRSAEEDAAFVSALRAETPSPLRERSNRVFRFALSARSAATTLKIGPESTGYLISLAYNLEI